jgi:ankyrin repeat protein
MKIVRRSAETPLRQNRLANFPQTGYSQAMKMNSSFSRVCHSSIFHRAAVMLVVLAWTSLAFCGEIHDAVQHGDLEKIKALLKSDPNLINDVNDNNHLWTPLHWAADVGNKDAVALLLAYGADVNVRERWFHWTPLILAAKKGRADVVALLLSSNADVNAQGTEGGTALHFAAEIGDTNVAKILLANKTDINAKERLDGKTPLHIAANKGQTNMVELLLANKADVNATDGSGWTPLHWAAESNWASDSDYIVVAKILLAHKAKINARAEGSAGRPTPMYFAIREGHKEMAAFLLLHGGLDLYSIGDGGGP